VPTNSNQNPRSKMLKIAKALALFALTLAGSSVNAEVILSQDHSVAVAAESFDGFAEHRRRRYVEGSLDEEAAEGTLPPLSSPLSAQDQGALLD
jgi:hypothetical protein